MKARSGIPLQFKIADDFLIYERHPELHRFAQNPALIADGLALGSVVDTDRAGTLRYVDAICFEISAFIHLQAPIGFAIRTSVFHRYAILPDA